MKEDKIVNVAILIPLYNDWQCLYQIIQILDGLLLDDGSTKVNYVVVNDNSTQEVQISDIKSDNNIEIVNLTRNIGHQKAIAIGLSYISENVVCDKVVVMDVDGEDRPQDVGRLLQESRRRPNCILFAKRGKRSEGIAFILFYRIYKRLFRILTGSSISFGNFCIIPFNQLKRLVHVSEIWNHFSGGVIRSKLPYDTILSERGKRFFGDSKMNFISLLLHGLSAVVVYIDIMAIRLIILTAILISVAFVGIAATIVVKLFTDLAIPGWATTITLGLFIVILQAFILCVFMVFMVLSNRVQKNFIPAIEYRHFIFNTISSPGSCQTR